MSPNDCLFFFVTVKRANPSNEIIKIKTTPPRMFITLKKKKINKNVEVKEKKEEKKNPVSHSKLRYIITTDHKFLTWNIVFEKVLCES